MSIDSPQISTDFVIMWFFIFELLTDGEEELIRQIAIIFRRASFSFYVFLISKKHIYVLSINDPYLSIIHNQFIDF